MALDKATVVRIANLARIRVPVGELDHLAAELDGIVRWVEQLKEVDTSAVEPMTSVVAANLRTRPDVINDGGKPEDILANAPDRHGDFFAVPKVVE